MSNLGVELVSQSYIHEEYVVTFFDDDIITTVTHEASVVDDWISSIEYIHRWRLHRLVVGLDVEWRPNFGHYNNPVAILQLCVGRCCLIFQLIHCDYIPDSLVDFLSDENYTFVGVGVDQDVEKLQRDYDLEVQNAVDLRVLAGESHFCGLKDLARDFLHVDFSRPRNVTLSRWDYYHLTLAQIQYACADAFTSFKIGRILEAGNHQI